MFDRGLGCIWRSILVQFENPCARAGKQVTAGISATARIPQHLYTNEDDGKRSPELN